MNATYWPAEAMAALLPDKLRPRVPDPTKWFEIAMAP
jgi:hypothetical protein